MASVQAPLPPILPALHGNAFTPEESSFKPTGTSGFLPSPTEPETILQTLPADFLHLEIADSDPDRTAPPARTVCRVQAGDRDGSVSEPLSLTWL